jgi:hypothetical protein
MGSLISEWKNALNASSSEIAQLEAVAVAVVFVGNDDNMLAIGH